MNLKNKQTKCLFLYGFGKAWRTKGLFSVQYKFLKNEGEPHVKIEGKDTEDWMCIDFGGENVEGILLNFLLN